MVKELRVAKLKKELKSAKETIAQLDEENRKLNDRLVQLEDVIINLIFLLGTSKPK